MMPSPPGSPASDDSRAVSSGDTSSQPKASEPVYVPAGDGAAAPRDVLIALTYGLELARHGAMLVAEGGRPQLLNRAALNILQKKDGIALTQTGLVAERASDTRLLHRLLEEAIYAPQSGEPKESPIVLERKSARSSLLVRVVPGPGLDCWRAPGQKTALLKLYDQDQGL